MRKTDHEGATGGIHRQVLSGKTANDTHLSEGLLVDFLKGICFAVEPQYHDASAVRADENEIRVVSYALLKWIGMYLTDGRA